MHYVHVFTPLARPRRTRDAASKDTCRGQVQAAGGGAVSMQASAVLDYELEMVRCSHACTAALLHIACQACAPVGCQQDLLLGGVASAACWNHLHSYAQQGWTHKPCPHLTFPQHHLFDYK